VTTRLTAMALGRRCRRLEAKCAALLGKPAGKFFATGTGGQQACIHAHAFATGVATGGGAVHTTRPFLFVHPTSHLVYLDCLRDGAEQAAQFQTAAAASMPGFDVRCVGAMARVLTYGDVEMALATLPVGAVAVLVLELPQRCNGGGTIAYADLCKTSALCKARGVKLHCDGARLWEVAPYYREPLVAIAALFDTVRLPFHLSPFPLFAPSLCLRPIPSSLMVSDDVG
jgi:threonine aldolase